jgi:glycosyltransferase involved in cell wall biosynthesis
MMKDLVTIVIPCKNEEKYIGRLLSDIADQEHLTDVEVIIADAYSTDNTLHIINQYRHLLNIKVVDGGRVSVGRNNGAEHVFTPYILFLDADVRFFNRHTVYNAVQCIHTQQLDLVALNPKNYGTDWRASLLFHLFGMFNNIMAKTTPFAIGAFFLTRRERFEQLGGFPNKYETSEDYILSKQYDVKKFKILNDHFGQDERRFKKLGYLGMLWYMVVNFFNRNNLKHFEKANVNYWY